MHRFVRRMARSAFVIGIGLVVLLSVMPQDSLAPVPTWDKLNHVAAYLALALSGMIGFRRRAASVRILLGLFALGIGLEGVQAFLPSREASVADVVANGIGVLVGGAVALVIDRRLRSPEPGL